MPFCNTIRILYFIAACPVARLGLLALSVTGVPGLVRSGLGVMDARHSLVARNSLGTNIWPKSIWSHQCILKGD
jgi:hypothetical protein